MVYVSADVAGRAQDLAKPAVAVVSSHVVRGGVGGRAAVFALERLGFPVWSLPTVVLPWHPGHGRATRIVPEDGAFASAVGDLAEARWLAEVGGALTGYFGDADQVAEAARLVGAAKAANPAALFLCDPVVGDSGGPFQPQAVVDAIRRHLVPLADIATPNRFELMALAGGVAADNDELAVMAAALGPRETIVTSAFAPEGRVAVLLVEPGGVHLATHDHVAGAPHGTGDLFAALCLAHRLEGAPPLSALERAAGAVLALVRLAAETGADELPLADGQESLVAPPVGITIAPFGRV